MSGRVGTNAQRYHFRLSVIWVISAILAAAAETRAIGQTVTPVVGRADRSIDEKDVITIIISGLALLISVGVAVFNWWSWKKKNLEDAKKALTEAIVGMISARKAVQAHVHEFTP
jgi:hypothetical protein